MRVRSNTTNAYVYGITTDMKRKRGEELDSSPRFSLFCENISSQLYHLNFIMFNSKELRRPPVYRTMEIGAAIVDCTERRTT